MTSKECAEKIVSRYLDKSTLPYHEECLIIAAQIEAVVKEEADKWDIVVDKTYEISFNSGYKKGFTTARKMAKGIALAFYPKGSAHTYASENADLYYAQEITCEEIADRIAKMEVK